LTDERHMHRTARGYSLLRVIGFATVVAASTVAGVSGYQLINERRSAAEYRQRLADLRDQHDQLRRRYNEAVRKTAVTELIVENGRLDVVIRTEQGELRRIETPFDPRSEIYVDYVVLDGRLWIRRIFDQYTPPGSALVIDPVVEDVHWPARPKAHGKAVYRSLEDGRWVVTVTGDGSLGLARKKPRKEPTELQSRPRVSDFEPTPENR